MLMGLVPRIIGVGYKSTAATQQTGDGEAHLMHGVGES